MFCLKKKISKLRLNINIFSGFQKYKNMTLFLKIDVSKLKFPKKMPVSS
jgi:hypothetical protein